MVYKSIVILNNQLYDKIIMIKTNKLLLHIIMLLLYGKACAYVAYQLKKAKVALKSVDLIPKVWQHFRFKIDGGGVILKSFVVLAKVRRK